MSKCIHESVHELRVTEITMIVKFLHIPKVTNPDNTEYTNNVNKLPHTYTPYLTHLKPDDYIPTDQNQDQ